MQYPKTSTGQYWVMIVPWEPMTNESSSWSRDSDLRSCVSQMLLMAHQTLFIPSIDQFVQRRGSRGEAYTTASLACRQTIRI